jgi:Ca-activated chloride channel homolog
MRTTAACVLVTGLLLFGMTALDAQQESNPTFSADTRLVVLHATVVDAKGRLVTNLPQTAFTVIENNTVQPVKTFQREDVPVSLALVVDNSGSMRNKRKEIESAALAMINASNPRDEVTIVNFNDAVDHTVPFTSDIKKLEAGLSHLDSKGGTAMRDAVSLAIDLVKKEGKHDKKVVAIITDGNDTASTNTSLEQLVEKAHQTEVAIFSIGFLNDEDKKEAKKAQQALEALAKASGGNASFPRQLSAVSPAAVSIASEIRNQYVIAYSPTNTALDGTFRTVRVQVKGSNNPKVRTRSGYYANSGQQSKASLPASTQ